MRAYGRLFQTRRGCLCRGRFRSSQTQVIRTEMLGLEVPPQTFEVLREDQNPRGTWVRMDIRAGKTEDDKLPVKLREDRDPERQAEGGELRCKRR